MDRSLVGVIGGVGPLATAYFLDKVIRLTEAERDQEHVDMVVLNHASIPDRTAFVLGWSQDDPGLVMAEDARKLENLGVGFIVIPCNTAHHFTDQVAGAVTTPVVSIIEETVNAVLTRVPDAERIGVLATEGTVAAKVYQRVIEAHGRETVLPSGEAQNRIMRIIYDQVKAGNAVDTEGFLGVIADMRASGADAVILGCTELSIVHEDMELNDPRVVDSLDVLARVTIEKAGHIVRQ